MHGARRPAADLVPAPLLALVLSAAWILVDPRSPDLAAQVYRTDLFRTTGLAVWDNNWYDGHHLPGYSLLFPALASFVGLHLLGVAAVVTSSTLFAILARERFGPHTRAAAAWFAVGACGDLWIGRLTFALGVTFGLAAVLAQARRRPGAAVVLAALTAAASPVAGLFLALTGAATCVAERSARRGAALLVPPITVVLAMAVLFPEGGAQPFAIRSCAAALAATGAVLLLIPRGERHLRTAAILYLIAVVASLVVLTPVGSNVVRFGALLAGPLLLCTSRARSGTARRPIVMLAATALAFAGCASWTLAGPIAQSLLIKDDPSVNAAFYRPVLGFLAPGNAGMRIGRLEVPFTRSHWESVYLAGRIPLARGWERQLDVKYNGVISGRLTAFTYRHWLHANAVSHVAISDAVLDPSSVKEGALIRRGLPYLQLLRRTRHWRIYRVLGALALSRGPGRLTALAHDRFTLSVQRPGRFLVRLRYTPYWTVIAGAACVGPAPSGWTSVTASAAGPVVVAARWSVRAALRADRSCRAASPGGRRAR